MAFSDQSLRLLAEEPKTPLEAGEVLRTVLPSMYPALKSQAAAFVREDWKSTKDLAEEVFARSRDGVLPLGSQPARLLRESWDSPADLLREVYAMGRPGG